MKVGIGFTGGALMVALVGLALPASAAWGKTVQKGSPKATATQTAAKPAKTAKSHSMVHHDAKALSTGAQKTAGKSHTHSQNLKKSKKSQTHKMGTGRSSIFHKNTK